MEPVLVVRGKANKVRSERAFLDQRVMGTEPGDCVLFREDLSEYQSKSRHHLVHQHSDGLVV